MSNIKNSQTQRIKSSRFSTLDRYPNHIILSFSVLMQAKGSSNLRQKKKKRHPIPSNLVLLEFGHVLFSSTILFERECYKEKKSGQRGGVFQVVVKSISQLGHWVIRWMMIRGYLERSPPITVRTTAEKGGVGIPLQGDVAKNKRPWRKRNSEIRENKRGRGQIGWKLTRGFPYGSLLGFLF